MAKTRHQPEPTSNKPALLIMGAGIVLVAALVVWALTRTVEPAAEPAASFETATTAPAPAAAEPPSTAGALATTDATATAPPPPQPQGDRSAVQRIAVEDLRAKLNRNEVTVIDVRDAASYSTRHIAGAINVPFASVQTMLDQIPKDKPIVTYCT
jgi:hypothetical protein